MQWRSVNGAEGTRQRTVFAFVYVKPRSVFFLIRNRLRVTLDLRYGLDHSNTPQKEYQVLFSSFNFYSKNLHTDTSVRYNKTRILITFTKRYRTKCSQAAFHEVKPKEIFSKKVNEKNVKWCKGLDNVSTKIRAVQLICSRPAVDWDSVDVFVAADAILFVFITGAARCFIFRWPELYTQSLRLFWITLA